MASLASTPQQSQAFYDSAEYHRSSPDLQKRLRNYIQRHTNENVDVILTDRVQTAAVIPASEDALLEDGQTDLEKREAKRLTEATDGDYLILITTNPATLDKLNTITRQDHADQNKQIGLALHELLHILHTDVSETTSAIRNRVDEKFHEQVHRIFNAIEDGAIEHSVFESDKWTTRAENRITTVRTAQSVTLEDLDTPTEYSLWDAIDGTIYERAIHNDGKIDALRDESDSRVQFRSEPEQEIYEALYSQLEDFIYDARSKPTSVERVNAVINFWKSTLKPIFDQEDDEQQQQGSDQGKSDGEDSTSTQSPSETPSPSTPETENEDSSEDGPSEPEDSDSESGEERNESPEQNSEESSPEAGETDQSDRGECEPKPASNPSPGGAIPDDVDLDDISADSTADQTRAEVGQPIEDMPDIGNDDPVSNETTGGDSDSENGDEEQEPNDGSQGGEEIGQDNYEPEEQPDTDSSDPQSPESGPDNDAGDSQESESDSPPEAADQQSTLGEFTNGDDSNDSSNEETPDSTGQETPESESETQESAESNAQNESEANEPAIPESGMDEDTAEEVENEISQEETKSGPETEELERELDEVDRSLQNSSDAGPGSLDELLEGSEPTQSVSNKRWNTIRNEARHVGQQLKKALEKSANDSKRSGLTSGRLDRRQLGKLGMGDPHGFSIDLPGDDKEYDVVFVIDGSGSMSGNKMHVATEAVARMSLAAEDLGVNVAITRFRSNEAELVKPFSLETEYIRDRVLDPYAQGGTPLADSLELARELLEAQQDPGHRPLIITMTDGKPKEVDDVREQIRRTHAPIQSLTVATDCDPSDPPEKAESLKQYWAGHTYVFDENRLDQRLDDFIARLAGV